MFELIETIGVGLICAALVLVCFAVIAAYARKLP